MRDEFTGDVLVEFFLPDHATKVIEAHRGEQIQINGSPILISYFKRSLDTVKPSSTLHISELPRGLYLAQLQAR